MTIEEMKARKRELGLSNETLAQLSGIPFSTVQKIFSGMTRSPRQNTIQALEYENGGADPGAQRRDPAEGARTQKR